MRKKAMSEIRVNLFLRPEIAARLRLAVVDTTFGGVRYGEQTRIVNQALQEYFERNQPCTVPKPSVE